MPRLAKQDARAYNLFMLRIDNLTKHYDQRVIFQGLTHSFAPGCVALCEEESTGKTTFLNLLAGVLAPERGDVFIDGYSLQQDPAAAKARLGFVPADCLIAPQQTGRELLLQTAQEKGITLNPALLELAHRLDLDTHLDKRFEQMSTGTRRKVYLVAAMIGDPAVIIADGPTDGVDAKSCAVLVEQFKLWAQTKVVIFASHDAPFVEACGASLFNLT